MLSLATWALASAGAEGAGGCRFHLTGAGHHPNDPNALFEWLGTWHLMWQSDSGWGHAVSTDLGHWSKLELAIDGPNAWDGSLSLIDGKPVALFDCTDPARDRLGTHHSCSGLNTTNATGVGNGIGDPSFLGIARPADLTDPNLTATWNKDPTAPITVLNETGGRAAGYSGPSPIWTTPDGTRNLIMTYGSGHTGLFTSTDKTLRNWNVAQHMFYPDRDAGGAMFLPLPGPPKTQRHEQHLPAEGDGALAGKIPFTHVIFGVSPGLGRGVTALGVYNWTAQSFSNTTGPPPTAGLLPLPLHDDGKDQLGAGGCVACGQTPEGKRVCCADLNRGYYKQTIDAGDVKFGQVWVDPKTKRMLWFAWAGLTRLSVVREITYDTEMQQLLMLPADELLVLRGSTPLGRIGAAAAGAAGPPPPAGALPLFTSNESSFDVEAIVTLPASGVPTSFGMAIMAQHAPVGGEAIAGNASAVLHVNLLAAAADKTRFVSMSVFSLGWSKQGCKPVDAAYCHTISYNFTLPAAQSEINVRCLVDDVLVELFVADGRGVISIPVTSQRGASAGVFMLGGGGGGDTNVARINATAWSMCM